MYIPFRMFLGFVAAALGLGAVAAAQDRVREVAETGGEARGVDPFQFVNWEDPHVHPMDMTPNGQYLLVVNTPDNRLEVFSILSGVPVHQRSIPVGIDPVSVRARSNTEAWVVNHISDTVSIVNLISGSVVRTLKTRDEPCDVVFAGGVGPAATRAFVSCSQANTVQVFDLANLDAAPTNIPIVGEDPRALGVSPDGSRVYVAVFESGNKSTVLGGGIDDSGGTLAFPPNVVNDPAGPYGGVNPPPNVGASFVPPIAVAGPPRVSLIVKKNAANRWMDDNGGDWTTMVNGPAVGGTGANKSGRVPGWDLYDHDLAIIDAATLGVTYQTGLMNICMAVGVNPATGRVLVVGTDGVNEKRFEPNLKGTFLRVLGALVDPSTPAAEWVADLNPHLAALDYAVGSVPHALRAEAIGDPRAVAWNNAGDRVFVAGMGSNNIVQYEGDGSRHMPGGVSAVIPVGQGPTGLALDEPRARLYVLNRFDATISVIDTSSKAVIATVPYFDPTPPAIKLGRPHLYDTHIGSGLGHVACASCHVDARFDRLAWDLGDPSGASIAVSTATRNLGQGLFGLTTGFQPYHPMKGPMTTQTLQDIIGKEPHHWRGDRLGLEEFAGAFEGLQGADEPLPAPEMQKFEDFLATIHFPPNPFRNFDNTLPTSLPLPGHLTTGRFGAAGLPLPNGNAVNGMNAYRSTTVRLDANTFACVTCHTLPTGAGTEYRLVGGTYQLIAPGPNGERRLGLVSVDGTTNITMKTPQLRNMYEKTGFNALVQMNTAGFGVLHDGSVDTLERFVSEPVFTVTGNQMVADLVAFMLAFSGSDLPAGAVNNPLIPPGPPSKDTHAAVGAQTTVTIAATADTALINAMIAQASANRVGLIVKGLQAGRMRGWKFVPDGGGSFQSDRLGESYTPAALLALAAPGSELTYTVVVKGTEHRCGIDRDMDGWLDGDEAAVCSDAADPLVFPGSPLALDVNGDLVINVSDIFAFLAAWFAGDADFDRSGATGVPDIFAYLSAWFAGCP
ncbi:MAG: hypothetical protein KF699_05410 [Phycisphaeraceae bacterium]|nr:hypothetical protein [Phycisphaeraceae bacterium]